MIPSSLTDFYGCNCLKSLEKPLSEAELLNLKEAKPIPITSSKNCRDLGSLPWLPTDKSFTKSAG